MLTGIKGSKAYSYDYVNKIGYDKFEQRNYLKYCNGSETTYTYDPERRRLSDLQVWVSPKTQGTGVKTQIISNKYTYDAVSNVLSVSNQAPLPQDNQKTMGGQMQHDYAYDGLYRLVQAQGSYTGADNKTAAYRLQMGYDNLHNIVSKNQQVSQQGIMIEGGLKAGYDLSYTYDSTKKNQIKTVQDINNREEESQEEEKRQEHKNYHYDLNGNLTYVNVELEKKDLRKTSQTQERKLRWDEENRLMSIDDNGYVSNYVYDATGERVIKTSGESEQVYINSLFSGGNTETQGFTAYINPYLVVSPNGKYTKHYYAGSQRIVSKLGDIESFGADPRRIEYAGSSVPGVTINWKAKYQRSIEDLKGNYAYFEVPYNGKDNDDYVNGEGFCCSQNTALRAGIGIGNVNYEKMQYYYHPDHLGSSSYITNLDGEIVQHVEYVPFGEVFIEERNNSWNTPYLFNGKELDEETGLYYYGARYYNPRESVWLSVDPLFKDYLDIDKYNDILDSRNLNHYAYAFQNPVNYIDYEGAIPIPVITGMIGSVVNTGINIWAQSQDGTLNFSSGKTWARIGTAAGTGFVAGATGNIAVAAAASGIGTAADQIIVNDGNVSKINTTEVAISVGLSVLGGSLSKAIVNSSITKSVAVTMGDRLSIVLTKGSIGKVNNFYVKHGMSPTKYYADRVSNVLASSFSDFTTGIAGSISTTDYLRQGYFSTVRWYRDAKGNRKQTKIEVGTPVLEKIEK
ncbi:RHS repeat domain-containing protein [Apibacter sp. B2966]|uniref:RHS repeat domain-containing protein n=1 Tax=Apibacter sp. B2966 TaxID=2656761 RepID=UPI0021075878|nr:RHS repeat-associated core domain-containing protein [Apibacter sp. B2966]